MTTGAKNDIKRATDIARAMVTEYAMTESLGQRSFGQKEELIFLGREISEQRDYGEEIATAIDREIKILIDRAYDRAREVLGTYREVLDRVATKLIEEETLDADAFKALLADVPTVPEAEAEPV